MKTGETKHVEGQSHGLGGDNSKTCKTLKYYLDNLINRLNIINSFAYNKFRISLFSKQRSESSMKVVSSIKCDSLLNMTIFTPNNYPISSILSYLYIHHTGILWTLFKIIVQPYIKSKNITPQTLLWSTTYTSCVRLTSTLPLTQAGTCFHLISTPTSEPSFSSLL